MTRKHCWMFLVLVPVAWFATPCVAAITVGTNASISISGTSGLEDRSSDYQQLKEYLPTAEPQTVSLSDSGEGSFGGQIVARFSSSASQTSTMVLGPLELRATVDASFVTHDQRLPSHPGPGGTTSGAVSDFEVIVDITDAPARYSFTGTLVNLSQARVVKQTPGGFEQLHFTMGGLQDNRDVPFNFTGTADPGRYSFRVNASVGSGGELPHDFTSSGTVRGGSLRITQVPEPGGAAVAGAVTAGALLRRRKQNA